MENQLQAGGSLSRRRFLKACGLVMSVSASYEAISLVLGKACAHAESVSTNVPDVPLDASLPNPPFLGHEGKNDAKGVGEFEEHLKEELRRRFEKRRGSAVGGIRG